MSRVTPFAAGDARDHRQVVLTNAALACWAVPVVAFVVAASWIATGAAPASLIVTTGGWAVLRAVAPSLCFAAGLALGLLAVARSAVRSRFTVTVIVLDGAGLVVAALLATAPAIAASLHG